LNRNQE
jgi:hypothetical protein